MNLVDSSGWFEYFLDTPNARHFVDVIQNTDELIVSPINYYEIYRKVFHEFGHEEANRAIGFINLGKTIELTTSIALEAAELSVTYHLHMSDSLLLATANSQEAVFWTLDSHFKDIPGVKYFEKE
jgi:predicted nucleic acid-binding protein